MSLTATVNMYVKLPDLAEVEAAAKEQLARLVPQRKEVEDGYKKRLELIGVNDKKLRELVEQKPKMVDQQLRGLLATLGRLKKQINLWESVGPATEALTKKFEADPQAMNKCFKIVDRPWGRTRQRVYITMTDRHLLTLREAGLLE